MTGEAYRVLLFYCYSRIDDAAAHHVWHQDLCQRLHLRGRIRIASEGLNGTVSGTVSHLQNYMQEIDATGLFPNIQWKKSGSPQGHAFPSLRVELRPTIVHLGSNISLRPGKYLSPGEFHEAVQNAAPAETVIIDCRNVYEWKIGRFIGAEKPPGRQFTDFPMQIQSMIKNGVFREKKQVLMYCTGGIRCEMGSSYLISCGISNVAQLHGGIHEYLEEFRQGGLFRGKNFVFDERIALPSESEEIIGECDFCRCAFDDYSGRRRCRHCRILMLICDGCALQSDCFDCGSCPNSNLRPFST